MRQPRLRFTIRGLMFAIVVAAALLALPGVWAAFVIVVAIPCSVLIGSRWLVTRGGQRLAGIGFWVLGIAINALYTGCCIAPGWGLLPALFLGYWIVAAPVIGGLGAAWGILSTRSGAIPLRFQALAFISLVLLTLLPLVTVCTLWPLRIAFLTARPSLESLADEVAAGKTVSFPQQAGVFRIAGADVDSPSGSVGLMIDPDPSGPTGFVRTRPVPLPAGRPPIIGSDLYVELGWGWSYRVED